MKKFLHLFISAVMLLSASTLFAATKIGDFYYNFNASAKTASVTSNPNSYAGKIVIPGEVENGGVTYTVTSIENSAFKDCSNLTAITISDGVTTIGEQAFIIAAVWDL